MQLCGIDGDFVRLPGPLPMWRKEVNATQWAAAAVAAKVAGGRLVSVWGSDARARSGGFTVSAAYAIQEGLVLLVLPLGAEGAPFPDISDTYPGAARMQRGIADLLGLQVAGASDAHDTRPWLRHLSWPADYFPLRKEVSGLERFADSAEGEYAFVQVEGEGVHEIAVGPVHAGIIEPGHFRFSVVGEKVLRLEDRLGYTHKGTEKLFERSAPLEAHRVAGRISGDSTVAYAWAYCMALESITGYQTAEYADLMRALLLERERVANHLGDLGALGNDAGLAFGLAQFSLLREAWLRLSKELFGHRLMMDCIVPGGVGVTVDQAASAKLIQQCKDIENEVCRLHAIYDEHAGLQDRFIGTGRVLPHLAAKLGLCGMAGRASGQAYDLRSDQLWFPYDQLDMRMATHRNGDVAARVILRFEEIYESLRLIRALCPRLLASTPAAAGANLTVADGVGMGWVEGWRGDVLIALELADGKIERCHCRDPSWHNWPILQHAVVGNIVPDFPLINKSFNLNYSGHDA